MFFLMSLGLAACGQTALAPTILPIQAPTLMSTKAPSSTPSVTATLTPFPTLGSGPYLMIKQKRESQSFSIYDSNGGRKIIQLPVDGHVNGLSAKLDGAVSPDGQWLVFYTGYTNYVDSKTELPLTLNS